MNSLDKINQIITGRFYLEFKIYSYDNGNLIIVGSEDLIYFHELEIIFKDVFAMSLPSSWRFSSKDKPILLLNEGQEMLEVNTRFRIEQGNGIFKLVAEDNVIGYVVCKEVDVIQKVVKYY